MAEPCLRHEVRGREKLPPPGYATVPHPNPLPMNGEREHARLPVARGAPYLPVAPIQALSLSTGDISQVLPGRIDP
jgi:hypothetical protein